MKIYKIITADNPEDLASQVNAAFEDKWYLYGDLVVMQKAGGLPATRTGFEYFQPMLGYKEEAKK